MLRIFVIALIAAFVGSITPALAQGTTGSTDSKHKAATTNAMRHGKVTKAKKGHKGGKKGKKGSTTGGQPPK